MGGLARRLALVAAAGLTVALVAGCGSSLQEDPQGADGGPVKVGLLVPQSGVYAPLGRDMENGFRMYLDAKGGKLCSRAVELVVADEGGGPDTGVPAAQKLLQQDRVTTLVGIVNSAVALGVRDLVTDAKVPLIIANAGANAITGELRSDYVADLVHQRPGPTSSSPSSPSAAATGPTSSPAASSRCSPSPGPCC